MFSIVMLISVGATELVTGYIGGSFVAVASHNIDYTSNATISFFITWLGDVLSVIRESLNPLLLSSCVTDLWLLIYYHYIAN
jgi:hypothetical protein